MYPSVRLSGKSGAKPLREGPFDSFRSLHGTAKRGKSRAWCPALGPGNASQAHPFFFFSADEMFVVGENDQTVYRDLKSAADFVPG